MVQESYWNRYIMKNAVVELEEKLVSTGMSLEEADSLLFEFLEEEAFEYVELMNIYRNDPDKYKQIVSRYKA